jgi:ubiquinone biosynthesis protein
MLSRGAAILDQFDTATRNGLVLAPETVADIGRAEARRSRATAIALWVIAALLAYIVYLIK